MIPFVFYGIVLYFHAVYLVTHLKTHCTSNKMCTKLYGSLSTFTYDLKIIFTLLNGTLRGCRKGKSLRNLYVTFTQLYKAKTLCNFRRFCKVA